MRTDRFHEMDPLRFSDGVRVTWRCGEGGGPTYTTDGSGKCYNILPEEVPHSPTTLCEWVTSYAWVYKWPATGDDSEGGAEPPAEVAVSTVTVGEAAPDVDKYFLGKQGADCTDTCAAQKLHCSWSIETHDSEALFTELGVKCKAASAQGGKWWAPDQPSFVSSSYTRFTCA